MTTNIIITSGRKYLDIDAYAGVIAYRELLKNKETAQLPQHCPHSTKVFLR